MIKEPILIIAAMEKLELNYILSKLENVKKIENKIYNIIEGEFEKTKIILCTSDIGLINASNSITYAIEKYNPSLIINEGIAGGYGENIHSGDIVIGTKCINITQVNTKKRQKGEGIKVEDYELITFSSNETDTLIYEEASIDIVKQIKEIENKYNKGRIHYGVIGSGDIWNREKDKITKLHDKYGIMCEEMEAISIYKIANKYKIPVVAIKSISNNETLDEEYDVTKAINSQEFTLELIKHCKNSL